MIDHYSRHELSTKLRCGHDTLWTLANVGPGFKIREIQRGTKIGYVIKKSDVYAWMDALMRDDELLFEAVSHANKLDFTKICEDRRIWQLLHRDIRRTQRLYQQRAYGRSMEDGQKTT